MKKIGIFTNTERDINLEETKRITGILKGEYEVVALKQCEDLLIKECDAVLSLGGDGTLLMSASKAAKYGKPVFGINLGNLGFLTGCGKGEFLPEMLENGETQERMMLKATLIKNGKSAETVYCLNDFVLNRSELPRLAHLTVRLDGDRLNSYVADGLIASTPTGSTAYSLAAGGPIIDPKAENILITPICPHMLHARPVVTTAYTKIMIESEISEGGYTLTADGKEKLFMDDSDKILIEKAEITARIIMPPDKTFCEILRNKL